jgi:hypothetical protein
MTVLRQAHLFHTLKRIYTFGQDTLEVRQLDAVLEGRALRPSRLRADLATPLRGDYLISSEKGVFWAHGQTVENVFPFSTFGLSIAGDQFYAAVSIGEWCYIVAARVHLTADGTLTLSSFRLLRTIETRYHNERIHQIHARGNRLAITSTRSNSILVLDAQSGDAIVDIYPLCDATGFPINTDQNHVNSVYQAGDAIFFIAHNAGNIGSFVGFIHGDRVIASSYPHRGIHDIVPTERGLLYSDTFGAPIKDYRGGGNMLIGRSAVLPSGHEKGFMVRGFAGTADEMLVGHSHFGRRADRFKASGAVLLVKGGKLHSVNTMPFAQTYDVIRIDGRKFDDDISSVDAATARALLARDVAEPVYDAPYFVLKDGKREYERGSMRTATATSELVSA